MDLPTAGGRRRRRRRRGRRRRRRGVEEEEEERGREKEQHLYSSMLCHTGAEFPLRLHRDFHKAARVQKGY